MSLQNNSLIQLQAENARLRQELAQCCQQHEQAASELWDCQEKHKRVMEALIQLTKQAD